MQFIHLACNRGTDKNRHGLLGYPMPAIQADCLWDHEFNELIKITGGGQLNDHGLSRARVCT